MASQEYWKNRETEAKKHNIQEEAEYNRQIKEIYANMMDEINKEINGFYTKYAAKEGITMAEAKKRVSKLDIAAYERKAKKYVETKDLSDRANEEMRIYNLTMKVNRLELLKANIGLEMVSGFDEMQKYFDKKLTDRTLKEFQRQAGILGKSVMKNEKYAHAIVNASFKNATYSDRIWMYQGMLKAELEGLLASGLIRGQNPKKLAKHLEKRFGVSAYNAQRLMATELARVQTEAQKQSFVRNGFDEYEYIACGNNDVCSACMALDGKHFKVDDMMPGENAPPMHPGCHCSVAAYMDDEAYEEWINSYKEHGLNFEDWSKKNSVAKNGRDDIINSGAVKGALTDKNDPLYVKRDAHAIKYYESVRRSKKSNIVKTIANNTGISEKSINKVYDHIFINDHELYGGKRRFDPDYDMAESFRRLREGKNIQEHDLIMLKHERLEYELMNKKHMSYQEAHRLAEKKYNYQKALKEFKNKNNL